jgi:FAD/FMN-containing dehydrogenase
MTTTFFAAGSEVLTPGQDGYAEVAATMFASGTPDLVVRPRVAAGVAAALRHAAGAYIGFLGSASDADVAAAYPPPTYERLAAIKRHYDPGNVLRRNHNVRPA